MPMRDDDDVWSFDYEAAPALEREAAVDMGGLLEKRAGPGTPSAPTVEHAMGEAVKPLVAQVEDNGAAVRQLAQVLSQLGRKLDERLREERLHLDIRFEEHEELMTSRAEGRLLQLTKHLEVLQDMQRRATEEAPTSLNNSLAPLEASLRRFEAALDSPRAALDARRSGSLRQSLAAAPAALPCERPVTPPPPQPRAPSSPALPPASGAATDAEGITAALDWLLAAKVEGASNAELGAAGPPRLQELELPPQELELNARIMNSRFEETCIQTRDQGSQLKDSHTSATLVTPPKFQDSRGLSDRMNEGRGLGDRMNEGARSGSLFSEIMKYKTTHRATQKDKDNVFCEKPSLFGLGYEEVLHYHTTAKGCMQRKISRLVLLLLIRWSGLQEPQREGCLARLVRSYIFEGLCAAMICANAAFMAYWANQRIELLEQASMSVSGEVFFLSWYIIEVSMKIMVHRMYFFMGSEMNWNMFDLILVVLAVSDFVGSILHSTSTSNLADATVLRALRVLKMAKILRVMRIMRVFNDLRLMLTSVIGSCVSLLWSFIMLAFVYYIFGLVFVQSMTDFLIEEGSSIDPLLRQDVLLHFGSLGKAMLSLFKATNGGNDWDYYYAVIAPSGWLNCVMFIFFIGFIQISLMNILTACFVERAMRLAQPDTISQAREQRIKERMEAEELRRMCMDMDVNNSGTVSADEFRRHIESEEMRCYFSVLGLDIRNAQEFFDMLVFVSDDAEVDIESFVQGCLRMRGAASGIAQQNLIMETRLLRRAQCDMYQAFTRRLDAITERLPS